MWKVVNFRCFLITAVCVIAIILISYMLPTAWAAFICALFLAVAFALCVVLFLNKRAVGFAVSLLCFVFCAVTLTVMLVTDSDWKNELECGRDYNVTGTITSVADNDGRFNYLIDNVLCDGKKIKGKINLAVNVENTEVVKFFKSGDRIYFCGELGFYRLKGKNLGYAYRNNVRYFASVSESMISFLGSEPTFIQSLKNTVSEVLNSNLGVYGPVAMGMLTGEKGGIEDEIRDCYSVSGLGHILAVSGLHVGFLVLLITWLLDRFKAGKLIKTIVIAFVLLFYCFIADFSPSVIRASVMCMIGLSATLFGKQKDGLSTLCFAVTVMLAVKPYYLFDVGFSMSVSAVMGILFFATPIKRVFIKFLPKFFAEGLAASLSAQIGITPITLIYFHSFPTYSVIVNMFVIPLVTVAFIGMTVTLVLTLIIRPLGILMSIAGILLALIDTIARFVSLLPLADIRIFVFSWFAAVFILYFVCSRFFMLPKFKWLAVAVSAALIVAGIGLQNVPYNADYDYVTCSAYKDITSIIRINNETVIAGDASNYATMDLMLSSIRSRKVKAVYVNRLDSQTAQAVVALSQKYKLDAVYCPDCGEYDALYLLVNAEVPFYLFNERTEDFIGIKPVYDGEFNGEFIGYSYSNDNVTLLMLGYGANIKTVPAEIINSSAIIRAYTYVGEYSERAFIVNYKNKYEYSEPLNETVTDGNICLLNLKNGKIAKISV